MWTARRGSPVSIMCACLVGWGRGGDLSQKVREGIRRREEGGSLEYLAKGSARAGEIDDEGSKVVQRAGTTNKKKERDERKQGNFNFRGRSLIY